MKAEKQDGEWGVLGWLLAAAIFVGSNIFIYRILPEKFRDNPPNVAARGNQGWAEKSYWFYYSDSTERVPSTYSRISDEFVSHVQDAKNAVWSATPGLTILSSRYAINRAELTVGAVGTTTFSVEGLTLFLSATVLVSADAEAGAGAVFLQFPGVNFGLPYFLQKKSEPSLGTAGYTDFNKFAVPLKIKAKPSPWILAKVRLLAMLLLPALLLSTVVGLAVFWAAGKLGLRL